MFLSISILSAKLLYSSLELYYGLPPPLKNNNRIYYNCFTFSIEQKVTTMIIDS